MLRDTQNIKGICECPCGLPKWPVESKHDIISISQEQLDATKFLSKREDILKHIQDSGMVLEVGTFAGDFAEKILTSCNPKRLDLIDTFGINDAWKDRFSSETHLDFVKNRFKSFTNIVQIHKGKSSEMLPMLHEQEMRYNFIYIDASHKYKNFYSDLLWASQLVNIDEGHIIGIDDFSCKHEDPTKPFEVMEATTKFLSHNREWKVKFFSFNDHGLHNIYISKN